MREISIKAKGLTQFFLFLTSLFLLAMSPVHAKENIDQFIDKMVKEYGFDKQELGKILKNRKPNDVILKAIARPAEKAKPWHEYRQIFLTSKRIEQSVDFWNKHKKTLLKAEQEYGVPVEIIMAIIGVETYYGKHRGKFDVVDALYTLGFHYPPRSKFFASELEHFLLMCKEENIKPLSVKGSYAGAMGLGQFISSSYRHYAVDFNGDNIRDLDNVEDAIGSVANYFKKHGWKKDEPVTTRGRLKINTFTPFEQQSLKPTVPLKNYLAKGISYKGSLDNNQVARILRLKQKQKWEYWITLHNFYVITRYNHSPLYAMAVYQLSQEIGKKINRK